MSKFKKTHKRKITYISLNVNIVEQHWNKISEEIDPKWKLYNSIDQLKEYLLQKKLNARKAINELYENGVGYRLKAVKAQSRIVKEPIT